jgi:hypothetical protein
MIYDLVLSPKLKYLHHWASLCPRQLKNFFFINEASQVLWRSTGKTYYFLNYKTQPHVFLKLRDVWEECQQVLVDDPVKLYCYLLLLQYWLTLLFLISTLTYLIFAFTFLLECMDFQVINNQDCLEFVWMAVKGTPKHVLTHFE